MSLAPRIRLPLVRPPALPLALAFVAGTLTSPAARAEFDPHLFSGVHLFPSQARIGRPTTGDPAAGPEHMAVVGLRLAWVPVARAALEAEGALVPTWSLAAGQPRAMVVSYGASLRVNVLTGRVRPFVLVGGGAQTLLSGNQAVLRDETLPMLHAGAGLEIDLGERVGLRLDGRAQFVAALGEAPFTVGAEALIGLYLKLGREAARAGGDGGGAECPPIPACPTCPVCPPNGSEIAKVAGAGPAPGPGTTPTTPKPPEPEPPRPPTVTTPPAPAAPPGPPLPEPLSAPDPDGDGDLDGVPNRADRCPAQPGPPENRGCPDLDGDGDGVVDRVDQCPEQPETRNEWQDEDGCPDEVPEDLRPFVGIQRGIVFRASSVELTFESLPLLDELARVLHGREGLRLQIDAYTDTSGNADRNTRMSQQRADVVRDALVARGIAASRLRAIGHGPASPVESNDTLAGRAANRRIELHLIGQAPPP